MKSILTYLILIIVASAAVGCQDDSDNVIVEGEEKVMSPYVGDWDSKGGRMYTSSLIIKEDNTFSFLYGACQMSGYSFGKWKMNGDEIILNSVIDSNECLFASDFLNSTIIITKDSIIEKKVKTTIEGCSPVGVDEEYVLLKNERFNISGDTLIHLNTIEKDYFNPQSHYKFSRRDK